MCFWESSLTRNDGTLTSCFRTRMCRCLISTLDDGWILPTQASTLAFEDDAPRSLQLLDPTHNLASYALHQVHQHEQVFSVERFLQTVYACLSQGGSTVLWLSF